MSFWEKVLEADLKRCGIDGWVREHRFCDRRWRFDFAFPKEKVAVEVDGGTYSGGRHVRGSGYERDCEKTNAAVVQGWRVLRFTTRQVERGAVIPILRQVLDATGPKE